ncbi:hypothetical protein [Nocardiopsis synnemataformans]|uniref:hypothetical protein n=1 Tax=Nocardiopsis synnemataformans TaxID=61305 RepID=UPI003EBD946E
MQLSPTAHAALAHHVGADRGEHPRFGPDPHLNLEVIEDAETGDVDQSSPEEKSRRHPNAILVRCSSVSAGWVLTAYHQGAKLAEAAVTGERVPHPLYSDNKPWHENAAVDQCERTVPRLVAAATLVLQARHDYRIQQHAGLTLALQEMGERLAQEEDRIGSVAAHNVEHREAGAHRHPEYAAYRRYLDACAKLREVVDRARGQWEDRARMWQDRLTAAGATNAHVGAQTGDCWPVTVSPAPVEPPLSL